MAAAARSLCNVTQKSSGLQQLDRDELRLILGQEPLEGFLQGWLASPERLVPRVKLPFPDRPRILLDRVDRSSIAGEVPNGSS